MLFSHPFSRKPEIFRDGFLSYQIHVDKVQLMCTLMTPIHQEARMFEVTAKAEEKLSEFFKARTEKPFIRIFLQQGG